MKRDLYAEVSSRIIEQLEQGVAPWQRDWSQTAGANQVANGITKRPYSGVNVVMLWSAMAANGYGVPRFLTFKQALELGGNVRKGEHGHKVYFVKRLSFKDETAGAETDDVRQVTMLREYTVFNVSQCDGIPDTITTLAPVVSRNRDGRDETADEFVKATGAAVLEGHGEACYRPGADNISLPAFTAYRSRDAFYATCFHEMTHWTGHKSRMDRDLRGRFGDRHYAAEELIAELGAAFLCAEFGFDNGDRHAAYIGNWIELLKHDKRAFFTACSKAQAAADYMRGLALADPMAVAA